MYYARLQVAATLFSRGAVLSFMIIVLFVSSSAAQSLQPDGWDAQLRLRDALDTNPDPYIVEVNIEAKVASVTFAPGIEAEAWTYNGGIPGPLIRVQQGKRLIVHFTNNLPQPTTIHWHGMRIPIQMDGVPGHSQPEVQPGSTFTYDFVVPDVGLFWYHPHVMSAMQVGYGLYGALLVDDPREQVGVTDELVLVLSDIGLDEKGHLESPDSAGPIGMAFGLEGNHVLANGREHPTMVARSGVPQRWRIVNAAKSKYFQLFLSDLKRETPFTVIGSDGGLQEYPTKQDTLVIAPGERVDAIWTPSGTPGTELVIRSAPYNRGYGSEYLPIEDLITIRFADLPPVPFTDTDFTVHRSITPLSAAGASNVNTDISLVQLNERKFEYRINDAPAGKLKSIPATLGETQIWTITNHTKWSHPFHLHGFFFQVLDKDGNPVRPLAWKDTVDVPFETTMRFIVRFDERPGTWMYHCHVLDHAEGGLMGMVELSAERSEHSSHSHGKKDY